MKAGLKASRANRVRKPERIKRVIGIPPAKGKGRLVATLRRWLEIAQQLNCMIRGKIWSSKSGLRGRLIFVKSYLLGGRGGTF